MEYVVKIIDSVIWPIAAIIITVLIRKDVSLILARLQRLKYKDVQADFEVGLSKVESEVADIKLPQSEVVAKPKSSSARELIHISPRSAIVSGWNLIDTAALKGGLAQGAAFQYVPLKNIYAAVEGNPVFPKDFANIIKSLRDLRNQAVHGVEESFSSEEAERYVELAETTAAILYHGLTNPNTD